MTRLIFIRHGESLGNAQRKFLGHTDWDLSEKGYLQAKRTAEYLRDAHIDKIYSSDLMRAYNTVVPVAQIHGLEIVKDAELREIWAGKWEGMAFDDIQKVYPEGHNAWMTDIGNAVCDGGESVAALQRRVNAAVLRIVEENRGKTVCIGTHATPIRTMLCAWQNLPVTEAKNITWVTNASVTIVDYDEKGSATLVLAGYADHLSDICSDELKNI